MDVIFAPHNTHLEGADYFSQHDPQLRRLSQQPYIYKDKLLTELPTIIPGIYSLTGGRQVGKTTLLKQWILHLLALDIKPTQIAYFSGELITDQHALFTIITNQLQAMATQSVQYLLIDEVTYIKDWDKTVKYLADSGYLDNTILVLTGSDTILLKEARVRFPGRRGPAPKTDFHLYPLSFHATVNLKCGEPKQLSIDKLFIELGFYLQHGGYLTAINDLAKNQQINNATLNTYSDWIRGDILKCGKQERYLQEIVQAIIKRYGSQISWNSLAQDLSIDHPKTVADYIELLASMDATFIQFALLEDKLTAAPKKARKVIFSDPFIFHALRSWITPTNNPYQQQIIPAITKIETASKLIEAIVVSHYQRHFPTYYIKAAGEVDVAYIKDGRFWPVEVKWGNQIRSKDLKQICKYPNGIILTKSNVAGDLNGVKTIPLPLALLDL